MNIFSYFHSIFTGGDWLVFFPNYFHQLFFFPYLWSPTNGIGLGQNISFVLGFKTFFAIEGKFLTDILHLPWSITEKLMFFIPYWIVGLVGAYFLGKLFFKNIWQRLFVSFLYMLNTYALMLVGGGQMGVALAYALVPWVIGCFFKLLHSVWEDKNHIVLFFCTTILLGLLFLGEIRLAAIVDLIIVVYLFSQGILDKKWNFRLWILFILVNGVSILLNSFWILPLGIVRDVQVTAAYTSSNMVKFLSFATFENALSLLHPNWPENIFGKTTFMKPEFLFLPILAYASLSFVNKKDTKQNLYLFSFAFLGLVGAFLAKGTNDPFGGVYYWMSGHIPGFVLFRDPTKWYLLIIISYSFLIPFTLGKIYTKISLVKSKFINLQNVFIAIIFCYVLFLIRPLFLGQLTGTFQAKQVPQDYITLKSFLNSQNQFSRTFWVPTTQRFGFFSSLNPEIAGYDFFGVTDPKKVVEKLELSPSQHILQDAGVKYVIVPFDSEGEIFLKDRKYDNALYQQTIKEMQQISWLQEVPGFGKIHVFAVQNSKDHFWLTGQGNVAYRVVNPTKYNIHLSNVAKGEKLVFSESYDRYWLARSKNQRVMSTQFDGLLNSFVLPESGTYTLAVEYTPQRYVVLGVILSGITALAICFLFISYFVYEKNYRKYTK